MTSRFFLVLLPILAMGLSQMPTQCSTVADGSFISFHVTTFQNTSGHRIIKSDVIFPVSSHKNGRTNWDVNQCSTVVNGNPYVHMTSSLEVPEQRKGPVGYELTPGIGWYRLHLQPLTWEEAKAACEGEGAHLAVLNSQQEADVLKAMFVKAPSNIPNASYSNYAFIGYSDPVEGQYITVFGETLEKAGYAVWAPGQPNNSKGLHEPDSNCGAIDKTGKLDDVSCKNIYAYFCESPL